MSYKKIVCFCRIETFARSRDHHHQVVYLLFGQPLKTFVEQNVNFEDNGELALDFILAASSLAYYVGISHKEQDRYVEHIKRYAYVHKKVEEKVDLAELGPSYKHR